jgi:FlaA1/EpsC-like NDP-sugar epimerase
MNNHTGNMFAQKTILITGGTGTWGQEFARQLLEKDVNKIVIFSRNESSQVLMKQKFNDSRLHFVIGDIRDAKAINEACQGIDYVFHTAALKHVLKCEEQPREAVKTNITGVQNVIEACINNYVTMAVNISTDKVCDANCFYGKTKAVGEGLFTEANNIALETKFATPFETKFISVRSGNILGSTGSVIPLWIKQIAENNRINLTDPKMKRFFILVEDAVKITLEAMNIADRGEVFVFRMPAFYVSDLAEVIIEKYGDEKTVINNIGLMPGERIIEWLITNEEALRSICHDHFYIIYPLIKIKNTEYPVIKGNYKIQKGYCMLDSEDHNKELLRELLTKAGY